MGSGSLAIEIELEDEVENEDEFEVEYEVEHAADDLIDAPTFFHHQSPQGNFAELVGARFL